MIRSLRLVAPLVLVTLVAGCSKGNLPPELTSPDDIAISNVTPSTATKLAPGSTVTVSANVSYILASASTGTIVEVVQDQNSVPITGSQAQVNVNSGQGTVTLVTPAFTVPATGVTSLQVFYSLFPAGTTSSSTVISAVYGVGT